MAVTPCPVCACTMIETTWVDETLDYGLGRNVVALKIRVPQRRCWSCRLEYMDYEAEAIRDQAVADHLRTQMLHKSIKAA